MIWIFALGIIGFCLVHKGFRKAVFWLAGILVIGTVLVVIHHP